MILFTVHVVDVAPVDRDNPSSFQHLYIFHSYKSTTCRSKHANAWLIFFATIHATLSKSLLHQILLLLASQKVSELM